MTAFLIRRLAGAFVVLALVSLMSFALIWLVPGDTAAAFLDASATPEQIAKLRTALGLDKPLPLQMMEWYGRVLSGDLGQSILLNRSVTGALLERLPVTLALAGFALVIAVVAGIAAGVAAAVYHNRWPDQALMTTALLGLSIPDFWLGLVMVLVFAVSLGWLPSGGFTPFTTDPLGWLRTVILPALTLGLVQVGFIARMARASMLETLNQDFIRTADAKGLSRLAIVLRHGLPNAMIPILTVIGIVAGALLGGTVIIEQVFSIPGIGRLIVGAIASRDFPVLQGGLLFLAVVYLSINLIVDILYAVVDPRVRLS
ncbi:MAG: ABC transporter permease [Chelatococcus sp.]|jgi:peptide/nickel transport system permease protein|uniref:ABC transporter permease n=1 Tax=unclassified Chelatococcus TaxID=2638111 RepID=UPI001BCED24F|nr:MULTISPECIES: ABC transporter permease [unclassified Chelatococcus]CAH1649667.1 putative peptide transport system permease protein BAB2_1050 [Hyphomicrobiales bacterium]MBS7739632.1 ABC transporter permease [Chelatococcus sp. HY11]MBX3537648.1 ABC transporter permease [Chelatococcus sp.]MBX3544001.1 ABC transporter permease [Chelatococcus sp.]MCO5075831.1 ABC transporter permease [Chelatococcus sp.]